MQDYCELILNFIPQFLSYFLFSGFFASFKAAVWGRRWSSSMSQTKRHEQEEYQTRSFPLFGDWEERNNTEFFPFELEIKASVNEGHKKNTLGCQEKKTPQSVFCLCIFRQLRSIDWEGCVKSSF